MMIPPEELARVEQTVDDARHFAELGQVLEGYDLLDLMLSWAEVPAVDPETGAASRPDPWTQELSDRYRSALVAYCESYGVSFALPEPASSRTLDALEEIRRRSRRLRETSALLCARSRSLRQRCAEKHGIPWVG
jgi:hypothetical protein